MGRISEAAIQWSRGKKKALDVGGPSSIDFISFGSNKKSNAMMGKGGGAQRPCLG